MKLSGLSSRALTLATSHILSPSNLWIRQSASRHTLKPSAPSSCNATNAQTFAYCLSVYLYRCNLACYVSQMPHV